MLRISLTHRGSGDMCAFNNQRQTTIHLVVRQPLCRWICLDATRRTLRGVCVWRICERGILRDSPSDVNDCMRGMAAHAPECGAEAGDRSFMISWGHCELMASARYFFQPGYPVYQSSAVTRHSLLAIWQSGQAVKLRQAGRYAYPHIQGNHLKLSFMNAQLRPQQRFKILRLSGV